MCPSEIVVLAVKDLFCRAPLVVVQYDFLVGHVPVVGQYAAVVTKGRFFCYNVRTVTLRNATSEIYMLEQDIQPILALIML